MCSNVMAGLSGLNMVYEAVGMHASLLGFSLESLILGDDMLGQALRCVRGIEVTDESISIDAMKKVCLGGPGHYLGSEQTLHLMQRDYVYPKIADRLSPKEWAEVGKPDLVQNAIKRKNEILGAPRKPIIDPMIDKADTRGIQYPFAQGVDIQRRFLNRVIRRRSPSTSASRAKMRMPDRPMVNRPASVNTSGTSAKNTNPSTIAQIIWLYWVGAMRFAGIIAMAWRMNVRPIPLKIPPNSRCSMASPEGHLKVGSMAMP